jgi:hypothetical protein
VGEMKSGRGLLIVVILVVLAAIVGLVAYFASS